jgi:hypothetical protein
MNYFHSITLYVLVILGTAVLNSCGIYRPHKDINTINLKECHTGHVDQVIRYNKNTITKSYIVSVFDLNYNTPHASISLILMRNNKIKNISIDKNGLQELTFHNNGKIRRIYSHITYQLDTFCDGRILDYTYYKSNGFIFEFKRNGRLKLICCKDTASSIDTIFYAGRSK